MPRALEVFISTRPWSFPMTIVCVGFGIAYGFWLTGSIDVPLSLLALLGSVLLHAAANVWNDYFDYRYGIDRPGVGTTVYRPHPIFANIMVPGHVLVFGTSLGLAALGIGWALVLAGRPLALLLGLAGFILAYSYTGPPLNLKYRGLGELGVFIAWGPLMVVGGAYVASGSLSLEAAAASVPLGLLVAAVLLANNIRDVENDRESGAYTLAVRIGRRSAIKLYQSMILAPYIILVVLYTAKLVPLASLVALASLPLAVSLARLMSREVPVDADPRTAKLVVAFGVPYILGTLASAIANAI
ncbi:1,4-dihydroxy-2-naphthoate octaprenyltransferase [Hyperthermus butylicus]|uniref:1,4-dihydroxy-2-naphthoate octaprenyltransferase n=1 Tax=Hyperthermus butylicus (strain DSM 5456 / JCM 9403 / PLM1-5) TaxID=415426 RepID=A2BMF3_HYPBU|nr:1,4-dihydroxy-2-naphthoate octaprenyltransferase [Hyperthermus butylicus]ABM81164.1 putative 1,4-dihydroxy-2-naphthoate octaprenyltransferase [Hyperthermus butylicus DSM 5456]